MQADLRWVGSYTGHAPTDVLTRNYLGLSAHPDNMPVVRAAKLYAVHRHMIGPLENNLQFMSFSP
ncbi:MAG: hypothetical protein NTY46_05675 [Candidatus Sumerlaeota bacterium]|nr:hypothetical protein [Candidatus Sumerlaeota bacterium]